MSVILKRWEQPDSKEFVIEGITFTMRAPDGREHWRMFNRIGLKADGELLDILDEQIAIVAGFIDGIDGAAFEDGSPVEPGDIWVIPDPIKYQLVKEYFEWMREIVEYGAQAKKNGIPQGALPKGSELD